MDTNSQEFLKEIIGMYHELPCLWKVKSKDYSNKIAKNKAYDKLVEKFKEVNPSATREDVVNKIKSMRTVWKKECKKVESSKKSGSGEDEIYVPSLWYYDLLEFLKDQEIPSKGLSSIESPSEELVSILLK